MVSGRMSPNPRLRVLYVHHRRESGGAPTSLALLIEGLGARVEAIVVCPGGAAADQFRDVGAIVIEAPVVGFSHSWAGTYRWRHVIRLASDMARLPPHVRRLQRALREFKPDLVHLNEMSLLPAAALARRRGVPVIWHLRAALPLDDLPDTRLVRWAVANLATVAIAINYDVAQTYRASPNMRVVFNPVRIPPLGKIDRAAAKQALGLRPEAVVVGMLSKIYALKGWRDLLEAIAAARREGTDLQLALVGGPVRPSAWFGTSRGRVVGRLARLEDTERDLVDAVNRLELTDAVHSVSFRENVSVIYAALDVVCAPSRGPELGRPVLEGQAHGLPVVTTGSTHGGGVVENDVDGLIVPAGDHEALKSTLSTLARDPVLRRRLGEHARRTAERRYSHEAVADTVLGMYRSILMPGGNGSGLGLTHDPR